MGNYSCSLISPTMKKSKAARVILPSGEIRQFREPMKAAELMLECPTFFLVNSRSLNIGRRFSPLAADEDLEFGNLYFLFPMKRVNSIVTAPDMAVFFMAANSRTKKVKGGNVRISLQSGQVGDSRLNLEGVEGFPAPEFKYRVAVSRSKKPMLDTIPEEPLCLSRKSMYHEFLFRNSPQK
ncbi:uncharacterized protein LOC114281576 [Camellia sinensis]|uniref:DUF4228 domain-containing protein n=1 Tax=Camellia sinensis var. sinensis TaxID=542762 RepID=A0A4S4E2U0_CAMSN|nr:uncharacterized protein LOC114281576 [Camellia sinensis]THG09605.1 hypothetical protein TEA_025098 [Camellia sinensis var. sinensis]